MLKSGTSLSDSKLDFRWQCPLVRNVVCTISNTMLLSCRWRLSFHVICYDSTFYWVSYFVYTYFTLKAQTEIFLWFKKGCALFCVCTAVRIHSVLLSVGPSTEAIRYCELLRMKTGLQENILSTLMLHLILLLLFRLNVWQCCTLLLACMSWTLLLDHCSRCRIRAAFLDLYFQYWV